MPSTVEERYIDCRDLAGYEDLELEDERDATRTEVLQKRKQPMALYMAIITCSIGTAVQ